MSPNHTEYWDRKYREVGSSGETPYGSLRKCPVSGLLTVSLSEWLYFWCGLLEVWKDTEEHL